MIFQIYGLQLDIPKEYKIILWKDSVFYEGTVEIHADASNMIKLDWNDLTKVLQKYSSPEEFFRENIERIKEDPDIIEPKLETYSWSGDPDHDYYFHKLSYKAVRKFPRKEISDYIIGLGIFCKNSNRFILLQYRPPEKSPDLGEKAFEIIKSFKCRCEA